MAHPVRIALCVTALVTACAAAPSTTGDSPSSSPQAARIIIKVRDAGLIEPTYRDLQRQARQAGATITYVRPLYGNVHLYQVTDADADSVALLLRQFATHANVEYVEPDRILRHQAPRTEKQ